MSTAREEKNSRSKTSDSRFYKNPAKRRYPEMPVTEIFELYFSFYFFGLGGKSVIFRARFLDTVCYFGSVRGTFYDFDVPRQRPPARSVIEIDAGSFAIAQLGLKPDKKQLQILRSKARRGILNCCR